MSRSVGHSARQVFDRQSQKDETLFTCLNIPGYVSELVFRGGMLVFHALVALSRTPRILIFEMTYISCVSVGLVRDV